MAARIGLTTGKEFVVEGTVDEVAGNMMGADSFAVVETDNNGRAYIFRAHVAYVEEEMPPRSVYEDRGVLGIDPDS